MHLIIPLTEATEHGPIPRTSSFRRQCVLVLAGVRPEAAVIFVSEAKARQDIRLDLPRNVTRGSTC